MFTNDILKLEIMIVRIHIAKQAFNNFQVTFERYKICQIRAVIVN